MANNPLHDAIYHKILKPALDNLTHDTDGIVVDVNYYEQTVNVEWFDPANGTYKFSRNLHIPIDGNGVYRESVKIGDRVHLAFKNADNGYPHITKIYRDTFHKGNYFHKASSYMTKGMGYF